MSTAPLECVPPLLCVFVYVCVRVVVVVGCGIVGPRTHVACVQAQLAALFAERTIVNNGIAAAESMR